MAGVSAPCPICSTTLSVPEKDSASLLVAAERSPAGAVDIPRKAYRGLFSLFGESRGYRMERELMPVIVGGIFVLVIIAAFAMPQQLARWGGLALALWVSWGFGWIAALDSREHALLLIRNAVVWCVAGAAFCAAFYGRSVDDEDGNIVSEGFSATFDSISGAAVALFLKFLLGSTLGILSAKEVSRAEKR